MSSETSSYETPETAAEVMDIMATYLHQTGHSAFQVIDSARDQTQDFRLKFEEAYHRLFGEPPIIQSMKVVGLNLIIEYRAAG